MPTDAAAIKAARFEEVYEIKEEVGRGQFAVVHRVVRRRDGAEFAAKVMRKRSKAALDISGVVKAAVEQEVRILLMLEHPNVIKLEEAYEEKHCFILVFELLNGGELFSKMLTRGRFSEAETQFYLREILCALQHLHSMNVVHLDIKPENVMLSDDSSVNVVKIIDFGLSRILSSKHVTRDMVGTPEFVAPEVINYDEITLATDMWSVGVLTYILLTGYSPFLGRSQQETYERVNEARCQLDGPHFSGVSDVARDFVRRLIRRPPKERATVAQCLQHSWLTLPVPESLMSDITNRAEVAQRLEINDSPSSGTSSPALTDRASIVSATSAMSRDTSITASTTALATPPMDSERSPKKPPQSTKKPSPTAARTSTSSTTMQQQSSSGGATTTQPETAQSQQPPRHHHHHHHHRDQQVPQVPPNDEQSPSSFLAARAARLRPSREPIVLLRPIPEQQSLLISARGNLRAAPGVMATSNGEILAANKPIPDRNTSHRTLTEQLKKLKPRARSPDAAEILASVQSPPIRTSLPVTTKELSSNNNNSKVKATAGTGANFTGEAAGAPLAETGDETVKSIRHLSLKIAAASPRTKVKKQPSNASQQHSPNSPMSPASNAPTLVGDDDCDSRPGLSAEEFHYNNHQHKLRIIHTPSRSFDEVSDKKPPPGPSSQQQQQQVMLGNAAQLPQNKKHPQQHHKFFRLLSSGTELPEELPPNGQSSLVKSNSDRRRGPAPNNNNRQNLLSPSSPPPSKRSNSPKEAMANMSRLTAGSPSVYTTAHTDDDSSSAFESASSAAFESLDNLAQQFQPTAASSMMAGSGYVQTSSLSHLHLMTSVGAPMGGLKPLGASSSRRPSSGASSSTTLSGGGGNMVHLLNANSGEMTSTSTISASPHSRSGSKKNKHGGGDSGSGGGSGGNASVQRRQSGGTESSAMRLLRKLSGKHRKTANNNNNNNSDLASSRSPINGNNGDTSPYRVDESPSPTSVITHHHHQQQHQQQQQHNVHLMYSALDSSSPPTRRTSPPASIGGSSMSCDSVLPPTSSSLSFEEMATSRPSLKSAATMMSTSMTTQAASRNLSSASPSSGGGGGVMMYDRRTSSTPTAEMMRMQQQQHQQRLQTHPLYADQNEAADDDELHQSQQQQQQQQPQSSLIRWLIGKVMTK